MTKYETQIMKGVAILFMIFLHLFNQKHNVDLCSNFIYIGDMPISQWLTAAVNPVAFYLILSGYGMHYIHSRGRVDTNKWNRIIRIYKHWWVILAVFLIPTSLVTGGGKYADFQGVILNALAFDTSWNAEAWFLFPFVCLSLLSPIIFRYSDRFKTMYVLIIAFIIGTVTSYIISRYGPLYLYKNKLLYNPFLIIHLAPSFVFGAMMQRTGIVSKYQEKFKGKMNWLYIIAIVIIMCLTRTAAWGPLYATAFIILFLAAPRWKWIDKILIHLGNHSMNMWLIHSWFCYYLFHDQVYSLRYPLLIFIVVTIASLLCSYLVNFICDRISFKPILCQNKK